jgi:Tol biopolymer transport system component
MPDVQEVFRLATSKVDPDPDALERQVRRQRAEARKSRVRAYVAVAAVLVLLGAAVFAISRIVGRNDVTSEHGNGTSSSPVAVGDLNLTFLTALPEPATPQTPAIVDRQGRQTSVLTYVPLDGYAPSISLDGTTIALVASPNELPMNQIVVMNTDGTGAHFVPTPDIDVRTVAISPDATQIAFEGSVQNNSDIYVINSDATGLLRLTNDPKTDQFPTWSPDGTTIAYDNAGDREQTDDPQFSKTAELYTVAANGGKPTRITHNDGFDAAPSYSADGKTIVDQSYGGFSTMNPDGSDYQKIPVGSSTSFTPRFSPDGKTLAFTYYKDVLSRPAVQLGYDYGERPVVILSLYDVATGEMTKLKKVGTATDLNTPQWVDNQHIFVLRVPANGV